MWDGSFQLSWTMGLIPSPAAPSPLSPGDSTDLNTPHLQVELPHSDSKCPSPFEQRCRIGQLPPWAAWVGISLPRPPFAYAVLVRWRLGWPPCISWRRQSSYHVTDVTDGDPRQCAQWSAQDDSASGGADPSGTPPYSLPQRGKEPKWHQYRENLGGPFPSLGRKCTRKGSRVGDGM